jgi:mRNA-degrading endonuclease RelE of RelBE toxin-antitoxin system
MRYRVEVSDQAHEQLSRFPRDVQERMKRAIDELEANDDSQWSNVKALQGAQWKGRFRKRVGAYRIIFRKFPDRGVAAISAVIIKSKDTYR